MAEEQGKVRTLLIKIKSFKSGEKAGQAPGVHSQTHKYVRSICFEKSRPRRVAKKTPKASPASV